MAKVSRTILIGVVLGWLGLPACSPAETEQNSALRTGHSLRGIYSVDPLPSRGVRWLSGRVHLPEDQPANQPVALLAHELGRGKIRRCVVSADGSFRLGVHRDAARVRIEFDSRFLYLLEPLVVTPKQAPALELRP
ncbi:MAG: hypothetical protein AAF368_11090, partial [Planctomycetota bacterium]